MWHFIDTAPNFRVQEVGGRELVGINFKLKKLQRKKFQLCREMTHPVIELYLGQWWHAALPCWNDMPSIYINCNLGTNGWKFKFCAIFQTLSKTEVANYIICYSIHNPILHILWINKKKSFLIINTVFFNKNYFFREFETPFILCSFLSAFL